jgi:hypothetical protein
MPRTNFQKAAWAARGIPPQAAQSIPTTYAPPGTDAAAPAPAPDAAPAPAQVKFAPANPFSVFHGPNLEPPEPEGPVQAPAPAPAQAQAAPPAQSRDRDPAEDAAILAGEVMETRRALAQTQEELDAERRARAAAEERAKQKEQREAEWLRKQDEEEFAALMKASVADIASLDPEDVPKIAKPIYDRLMAANQAQLAELERKIDEQGRVIAARDRDIASAQSAYRKDEFSKKLYAAVPELRQLLKKSSYATFLRSPYVPGSKVSMETHLNQELAAGNEDYVLERYRQFVNGNPAPRFEDIAQVAPSTTGDKAPPAPAPGKESIASLTARVNARRTGKIRNAAEYRAKKYGTGA